MSNNTNKFAVLDFDADLWAATDKFRNNKVAAECEDAILCRLFSATRFLGNLTA